MEEKEEEEEGKTVKKKEFLEGGQTLEVVLEDHVLYVFCDFAEDVFFVGVGEVHVDILVTL